MVVKEKVLKVPKLEDLVSPETTFDEYRNIIDKFITNDNREVLGLASNEKTVRAILNATKFGTEPFSAQRFGEEVCYDPDNEMIHLPGEQVVEIIIIGKRMGLFERAGIEQLVNRNPNLTKNLQRILGDYQRSSVSVSQ